MYIEECLGQITQPPICISIPSVKQAVARENVLYILGGSAPFRSKWKSDSPTIWGGGGNSRKNYFVTVSLSRWLSVFALYIPMAKCIQEIMNTQRIRAPATNALPVSPSNIEYFISIPPF